MTRGCRVAGVQPGPLWNGTRPPREKEMEQEIGLVSLFPSLVSLSDPPAKHAGTHRHTQPCPPPARPNGGGTWDCVCVCLCVYVCMSRIRATVDPSTTLNLKSSSECV